MIPYADFKLAKIRVAETIGREIELGSLNPALKPFNRDMVKWAFEGGRRAIFAAFGLHKTCCQLELMRLVGDQCHRLIITPLGVRQEFFADASTFFQGENAITLKFIQSDDEIEGPELIYLTNYESVREGKIDPANFTAVTLDEGSCLRSFGSKTFSEMLFGKMQQVPYRWVCTATPSPNEYLELIAYAHFLGIMDMGEAKTRFFKRNSEKADELTLHPHKTREFWLWVASWALFIQSPSDICTCPCHNSNHSKVNDSESSSSSIAKPVPGAANAIAAAPASHPQITSKPDASEVVAAFERSTEEREPELTQSGVGSSNDAPGRIIRTGQTTEAEASPSAIDGDPSRTSSPTWEKSRPAEASIDGITPGTTSPETASGQLERPKLETPAETSSSPSKEEANLSQLGPKSSEQTTGSFTAGTDLDGALSGCSKTWCDKCRCDEGYELPAIEVHWHEVPSDVQPTAPNEKRRQGLLIEEQAIGVADLAKVKKRSIPARIAKWKELRESRPGEHCLTWHDLEEERKAIEAEGVPCVYGSQKPAEQDRFYVDFRNGDMPELGAKPMQFGSGCNFQRHCSWAIFLGITFKFNDFIQAIHRIQRFGQPRPVRIDIIYSEAERKVRDDLEAKWERDKHQRAVMREIIRDFGLTHAAIHAALTRSNETNRQVAEGKNWKLVNDDSVLYCAEIPSDSQGMICTSIPFSTQYEYTPHLADFGHTDTDEHFFEQMGYLTPELLRITMPGRIAAIHVKDRVVPGEIIGQSYQTVSPFMAKTLLHFIEHGWTYMGMITVVTDVVRENAQTYRLSWSMQCEDGSRMGVGMPEYVLLFRKPPSDSSKGFADIPVAKSKEEYTRGRWQLDAHGFWRSNGNRLLEPAEFDRLHKQQIFRAFRKWSQENEYDHERAVALAEFLDSRGVLPPDFMLLQPWSDHPEVWSDVARMRSLNSSQAKRAREKHLCPLPFDIVDRLINRFSNAGETIFDPFGGIGTVPVRAVKAGRVGHSCELNPSYWEDSTYYLRDVDRGADQFTLFDLLSEDAA